MRPLKRILCVFDGEVVPFNVEEVASEDLSEGHRFMGSKQPFRAREASTPTRKRWRPISSYWTLDERKARILEGARKLAVARGLELVEDEGLLDEVAGLAEWPVALLGDMDASFLDLPPEVIRTSMRTHQRYFAVRNPLGSGLAPHFIVDRQHRG